MAEKADVAGDKIKHPSCDWLRDAIDGEAKEFEVLMGRRRRTIFWLKFFIALFGATATVLVGLQNLEPFKGYTLSALTLVVSALATFAGAWGGIFDYRGDWERFKATHGQLEGLKF